MSEPFEVFGPYAVYECLGQGGMATVHRAEKRGVGLRRPVALKRLLPHVATDPVLVKLFVDEARLASHLRHANVAQTYELGKVGDTFFIAMEYASGPTLTQIIRQSQRAAGEIPLTIIVHILRQICEALDYAHNLCDETGQALRIIHRDVSPANIIVTRTGVVKLIDFGIAKATISSVKTQTGFIKGKVGYIAPEYITGQIDARVDLFAVGVVAHELMTGRRLFEGKDDFETLQNIREMNLQPPSHWNPHVTADLDDIVMTALQRDPANRWQSAGAMQVALANVAREFGLVVGGQQLAEWVDWAFSQVPPGAGRVPVTADNTGTYQPGAPRPDRSLSIEVGRAPASSLDMTLPPETPLPETLPLERRRRELPSRRQRPLSEFDETVPLERIGLSRRDIELLTPSPVIEPPLPALPLPALPPPVPRSSRTHDAVPAPPPRLAEESDSPPPIPRSRRSAEGVAAGSPPPLPAAAALQPSQPWLPSAAAPAPPRASRVQDAVAPRPAASAPHELDGLPGLPHIASPQVLAASRPAPSREIIVLSVPAGAAPESPAPSEPTSATAKRARSRPARSTQKTRPQSRPAATSAAPGDAGEPAPAPRSRRTLVWLILLMIALGGGAMAAAYYLPDLLI